MATFNPYIGRREAIGLGIESTAGTAVAPQIWLRWYDNGFLPKKETLENESALGVVDRVNDSAVATLWAEGAIGGKITSEACGFLLLGVFGTVSTGAPTGGIYPHTFTVNQSSAPTALTVATSTPAGDKRYPYASIETFELTAEEKGWVMVSCGVKARKGVTSTETVVIPTTEKEFTAKNIVLKTAANTAGLGAAPTILAKSLKLAIERPSTQFDPLGSDDAPLFDKEAFEAKGEFVVRYTDDQLEADFLANTAKSLNITLTNGTTSLALTASKVRFRELDRSRGRDNVVTETIQFYCEYDTATAKSIEVVLSNTRATYTAA